MASTIKIKNSSTTGAVPGTGDLVQGELAINVTDTGLYTENASGTVVKLNAPSIDDKNTGATKYVTIASGGNVGIGTATLTAAKTTIAAAAGSSDVGVTGNALYLNVAGSASTTGNYIRFAGAVSTDLYYGRAVNADAFVWGKVAGSESMRLDTSGNLLVGTTTAAGKVTVTDGLTIYVANSQPYTSANAAATVLKIGSMTTGRSISSAGTNNASGADYAEYMVKDSDFTVAKGDIVGINAQGKLTNIYANAVSFAVKSTNPSYVGGDTWGSDLEGDALEEARQTVDRIAFAGQVPVNVLGAIAGQYIIPVNDNGAIKGEAVSNPTLEQYQQSVGKVIALEQDGRAHIIVKVA